MSTIKGVTDRAQAEALMCCNQPMVFTRTDADGNLRYECSKCQSTSTGGPSSDISRKVDNGTATPTDQQGSPTMPQPTGTSNADREHNTALLKKLLTDIAAVLHRSSEVINSLNRRNGALVGQVADAGEFAVATEQTSKSKQSLDEANGVTAAMDQHLGGMSTSVSAAEDATAAAVAGLKVVDEAEDDLRQAGAGTKAAAPARDGA